MPELLTVVLATTNPGKLLELRALLADSADSISVRARRAR